MTEFKKEIINYVFQENLKIGDWFIDPADNFSTPLLVLEINESVDPMYFGRMYLKVFNFLENKMMTFQGSDRVLFYHAEINLKG